MVVCASTFEIQYGVFVFISKKKEPKKQVLSVML